VVLTAATGLFLALAVLAGSFGWMVRDRTAREAVLEERVARALVEADAFCAVDRLPEASEAVKRAEEFLEGSGTREDLRSRVAQARDRVNLAIRLVEVRLAKADLKNGTFDSGEADLRYRDTFRDHGLDVEGLDLDQAARRIQASPIKDHLVAALDDWQLAKWAAGRPGGERLLALLRQADKDEWRNQFRDAYQRLDKRALQNLARGPSVLKQPPATIVLLATVLEWRVGERRLALEVLRSAQQEHPNDFWINHTLGMLCMQPRRAHPAEAVRYFQAALAVRPTSPGAHVNLGIALFDKGDQGGAIAAYRKAIDLAPRYAHAHNNLGIALRARGDQAGAIAAYREAIAHDPRYPAAHCNLGDVLHDTGDLAGAIAAYDRAISLQPDYAEAHNNLGVARHDKEDLDGALAAFQKAIACNPSLAMPHTCLGAVLRLKGDLDGAIAACWKAIALEPDHAKAHNNLGVALFARGDHVAAIAALQKATALGPNLDVAHYYLGNALRARGDLAGAIAAYRKAITISPDYTEPYNELGTALRDKGDRAEALVVLRHAIALRPAYAEAHTNLGNVLSDQGDLDGALAAFQKAIACNPRLATAYTCLGLCLSARGDLAGAIAAYRKAIALGPNLALNHYILGNALKNRGDLSGAVTAYRKAITLQANHAEAHCNLGHVLRRQGEFGKALVALRRGHEIGSRNPRWRYPSAQWVRYCERLDDLDRQLPAFLHGKAKPASSAERIELAQLCQIKRLYRAAARFYEEAFAERPGLLPAHRYNAACAAALAGCAQGADRGELDETGRAPWRNQALAWLRAELTHWIAQLDTPQAKPSLVQDTLRQWQRNSDLAGVRDAALDKLPDMEQVAWRQLWADVACALRKAQAAQPGQKK
jgi:superkiller protein 3